MPNTPPLSIRTHSQSVHQESVLWRLTHGTQMEGPPTQTRVECGAVLNGGVQSHHPCHAASELCQSIQCQPAAFQLPRSHSSSSISITVSDLFILSSYSIKKLITQPASGKVYFILMPFSTNPTLTSAMPLPSCASQFSVNQQHFSYPGATPTVLLQSQFPTCSF